MRIHEYQARKLLGEAGVPFTKGILARTAEEAGLAFDHIGGEGCVLKAQVHAGGRGKAGFVKRVKTRQECVAEAARMLSSRMVSPQTSAEGLPVALLLLVPLAKIARECYIGIAMDRAAGVPAVIASSSGGMEIEQSAKSNSSSLFRLPFSVTSGLHPFQARETARALGFSGKQLLACASIVSTLAASYLKFDASLVEINPLVETQDGTIVALDARMSLDDNAAFRHPEWAVMADPSQEAAADVQARKSGLSHVALDGNIACVVNGAGLAMATMDVIRLHGGNPANFLDVGGSVTSAGAIEAFRIILGEARVKGVLVNIFGGIARCDMLAQALLDAAREVGFHVPVVVRLEGNKAEEARAILNEARKLISKLIVAHDLDEAAREVVRAAQ